MRGHNERMQCPDIDAFKHDVANGMSVIDLAKKYHACHSIISRWRMELGLVKRGLSFNKLNKEQYILDCEVMTYKELEEKYNVSQSALQRWKCKLGIFVKPKEKTHEQFLGEVIDKYGDEYVVIGQYVNSYTKIKIKHSTCNHVFWARPVDFLTVKKCPNCTKIDYLQKRIKTTTEFKEEVFALVGNEYSVLGKYQRSDLSIKMKHALCGNIFETKPTVFLSGRRCPKCTFERVVAQRRTPHSVFVSRIDELYGDEFCVLGTYENVDTKIKVKHSKCGKTSEVTPRTLFHGYRCQYCQSSSISFGECRVQEFCEKHNLLYQRNFRIAECKNKTSLPFDFAIFEHDGALRMLIEFDGVQHFKSIAFWGGDDGLRYRKRNDNIKNAYCAKHNIPLIRISFNQCYCIEEILSKVILRGGGIRML